MGVKLGLLHEAKNTDWKCLRSECCGEYLDLRGMKWQEAKKMHNDKFHNLYFSAKYYYDSWSKTDDVDWTYSMHGRDEKFEQNFGLKT
jgi:hypothetical protein